MKDTQGPELPKDSEKLGYKFLLDNLRDQLLKDREIETQDTVEAPIHSPAAPPSYVELPEGKKYFRIGEVAALLGVEAYVLRYWESEFGSIRPKKSRSGQRIYDRKDVLQLAHVRYLLHTEKFSLQGAKQKLSEARKAAKSAPPTAQTVSIQSLKALRKDVKELIDLLQNDPF